MIEHSPDITELAKALHAAQSSVDGVRKDARNPHFKNTYASLESVIEAAKPALQKAGIAFTQAPGALVDGSIEVTTMLMHVSGQWLRSTLHVPLAKRDAQGVGSAITYGSRYSLMATLGLPPVDDDGEEASRPAPQKQAKPALVVNGKPSGSVVASDADDLMTKIKTAKDERSLNAITNNADNIRLYESLEAETQLSLSDAIYDQRASFSTLRAG